jgi:hypothetical protein
MVLAMDFRRQARVCARLAEDCEDQRLAERFRKMAAVLRLARSAGPPILTVEDNYVGGIGSEIAEAAAVSGEGPRVRMLAVRNIPKSGRAANDVLAYVHLSVAEIVQAAKTLTRETALAGIVPLTTSVPVINARNRFNREQ